MMENGVLVVSVLMMVHLVKMVELLAVQAVHVLLLKPNIIHVA